MASEPHAEAKAAAIQRVVDDPKAFIEGVLTEKRPSLLDVSALVYAVQEASLWKRVRDANVVKLFISLIVDRWSPPDDSDSDAPTWLIPLSGLINIMAGVKKEEAADPSSATSNESTLNALRSAYPQIVAIMHTDLASISNDNTISMVALSLYHFSRIPGNRQEMYTPAALSVVAQCWLHGEQLASRRISCVLLQTLMLANSPPLHAFEYLSKRATPNLVVSKLRKVLLNFKDDPSQLSAELVSVDAFVSIQHPTAPKFAESNIQAHVVQALLGQLESVKDADVQWTLLDSGAPFLNNVINASKDPVASLTQLIESAELLELAARAIILAAPRKDSQASSWFVIFKMLIHTAKCHDTTCRVHTPNPYPTSSPQSIPSRSNPSSTQTASPFHSAVLARLLPFYTITLDALDSIIAQIGSSAEDGAKAQTERASLWQAILSWRAFGTVLGLNEEVLRNLRKNVDGNTSLPQLCWWAKCENTIKPDEKLKRCSKCRSVTYCSAEHQTSDWKSGGHKLVCNIISNA